jgi:hypothetical protein
MAKITYMGWQEVVIHEIIEMDNERFFGDIAEGAVKAHNPQMPFIPPTVNWVNGIAFVVQSFPDTDDVVGEKLKGTVHYAVVVFTRLDYRATYPVVVGSETIPVRLNRKVANPIFLDMADYLKGFRADSRVSAILTPGGPSRG